MELKQSMAWRKIHFSKGGGILTDAVGLGKTWTSTAYLLGERLLHPSPIRLLCACHV